MKKIVKREPEVFPQQPKIISIMPAAGWRCFERIPTTEGVKHFEHPVVGWGLIDDGEFSANRMVMIVFHRGDARTFDSATFPTSKLYILPPGQTIEVDLTKKDERKLIQVTGDIERQVKGFFDSPKEKQIKGEH